MKSKLTTLILVAGISLSAIAQSPPPRPVAVQSANEQIYVVKENETITSIAERFLGNKRYAPELLRFNDIKNPVVVTEGYILSIPGQERTRSMDMLTRFESSVANAAQFQLEKYAPKEFAQVKKHLENARARQQETAYKRSAKYVELGEALLKNAIRKGKLAEMNAQTWFIENLFGTVHVSEDKGGNWKRAKAGQRLTSLSIVRTGAGAKTRIRFPDGSHVELQENSQFTARRVEKNIRSGRSSTRLQLLMGEMLGEIVPIKEKDSVIEVESENASISIRGTLFRMDANKVSTGIAVYDGHVQAINQRLPDYEQLILEGRAWYDRELQRMKAVDMRPQQSARIKSQEPIVVVPLLDPPKQAGLFAKEPPPRCR